MLKKACITLVALLGALGARADYPDHAVQMVVPYAAGGPTDTVARVMPLWTDSLAPAIRHGKKIIVSAHGNSLRALIKYLDGVSDADIVGLNIPNGQPLVYELDADLKPIRHYYLGDQAAIDAALQAVSNQGKSR